jgi:hypothetical protein
MLADTTLSPSTLSYYSIMSHATLVPIYHIHVNIAKLLDIPCTLVATNVTSQSLECTHTSTLNSVMSTPHNVTHSLISQNPTERTFIVQISLLIVTFLSLLSQNLSSMQIKPPKKSTQPHCTMRQHVEFFFFFFFFFYLLLNVGACVRHITWEGQVEWTRLV